ncbi:hypothetical protein BIV59_07275 [Bacillus sp. MUM 13]|nr:hypothetical protein BIV59_07275 [Bacillus sp. MUM 13]
MLLNVQANGKECSFPLVCLFIWRAVWFNFQKHTLYNNSETKELLSIEITGLMPVCVNKG